MNTIANRMRKVALALALSALLAGCGGESGPQAGSQGGNNAITPVEITRSTASVIDGMLLADYPGPKGQIHYAGQAEPDFFCNTKDMMYVYLVPEQLRKVQAMFVQDMGQANWDEPQGHWIEARQALYVVGSNRRGSMGATLGTFARDTDAQAFAQEYGGTVLRFDQLDLDSVLPPDDGLDAFKD